MLLEFSTITISLNANLQVPLKDVKTAAVQLGFKGKDELVMEPRTNLQGEDGADGPDAPGGSDEINFGDQGRRETFCEKQVLVDRGGRCSLFLTMRCFSRCDVFQFLTMRFLGDF